MNFKQRDEQLRKIIKKIRDGTFEYQQRDLQKRNWTIYDQAQINELADFIENTREVVDEAIRRIEERAHHEKRYPGRPPIDPANIAKVLILQEYISAPNRVAEGLLRLFREKLGINSHFSYKTIERGYDREQVNKIFDEVNLILNRSIDDKEDVYSFDGTGFSSSAKDNYAAKRQKQNSQRKRKQLSESVLALTEDSFPRSTSTGSRNFTYSVFGVGIKYKLIAGTAICADHSIGETGLFPEAFHKTKFFHPDMKKVLGDGIYGARWIVDLVARNNITPYFFPRSNVTFKSKGYSGWWDMLIPLQEDPQNWLKHYHMRSISETVNSMLRCRFNSPLKKRLAPRKDTETKLKLVAHNIRRIGYLRIIDGIEFNYAQGYS